jgi:prevent-host-death family protein
MVHIGGAMKISVSDAKGKLTDLVRRAESGDEIVLTRHGRPAARLVAVSRQPSRADKRALLDALRGSGKKQLGPDAARSQDFLYDDHGLPG